MISKQATEKKYWEIEVVCWGTLYAIGTEEQAEEWRKHKANWEQCIARKKEIQKTDLPKNEKWAKLTKLL